jgi:hypothetical protein
MRAPLGPLCPGCPPQPDRGVIFNQKKLNLVAVGLGKCNKTGYRAFLILAHVSGGFADRHCRLNIGLLGAYGV